MTEKTLGETLINSIEEALSAKEAGHVVRPDVAKIRKELQLTQQQFSKRYHIKLETLRNWEQLKRTPDTASLAYLACIVKRPTLIKNLLTSR